MTEKLIERLHKAANELEAFRLQMALGRAEARESIHKQVVRMRPVMHKLKTALQNNKVTSKQLAKWDVEIKKIRIKTDILKLRYELKKLQYASDIKEFKKKFTKN